MFKALEFKVDHVT